MNSKKHLDRYFSEFATIVSRFTKKIDPLENLLVDRLSNSERTLLLKQSTQSLRSA